jgi:predicted nuclease of predicted toxin-antitoxin system
VKILLDNNLDWRFARYLPLFDVVHVIHRGWADLKNGELVQAASADFDVMVTTDKNMRFQTRLDGLPLAVAVLDCSSNRLADTVIFVDRFVQALPNMVPGKFYVIEKPDTIADDE